MSLLLRSSLLLILSFTLMARAAEGISSRPVTFELTFEQNNLTWLGDPASPVSRVAVKKGAPAVATDVVVRTLTESDVPIAREYMAESRLAKRDDGSIEVYAFTPLKEKLVGTVNEKGEFIANDFYRQNRKLLPRWPDDPAQLHYEPSDHALARAVNVPGNYVRESLDFLPLDIVDASGNRVMGEFEIKFTPATPQASAHVALLLHQGSKKTTLASAVIPDWIPRANVSLGSFDNKNGTYLPDSLYRDPSSGSDTGPPLVTLEIVGDWEIPDTRESAKIVVQQATEEFVPKATQISVDGNFDDWRNVSGVDDPLGDTVSYLDYLPDVDILEFKVASDQEHIFFYVRVAGQVGRTAPQGGRSYFYAYMDVDQNPGTGFLPSRDDECYFGVSIGDDCEVQFEFVNNALRKTFYGFCGLGGNDNVLKQQVTIGKSQYGRLDESGRERADYKAEYIYRNKKTEITEDLKLGTSDSIQLAVSPDGHEVEVVSTLAGFLQDSKGKPTVRAGQKIDVAAGMEGDCKLYPGRTRWGADNTLPIRSHQIGGQKVGSR
ncbi:hypothetical protein K2X85_17480 [bacterium]|nr:hypothetical protein [bacterium]